MISPHEMDKIPFLHDLGGPYAGELARLARLQEFPAGAVIFKQGQDTSTIFLVLDGEVGLDVRVSPDEIAEVHRVLSGDFLGWSPVLGRRSMTATARAATPARLALLDVGQILQVCERNPLFGAAFFREMARVLSSRLDDTRRRLSHHLPRRWIAGCPAEGSD